MSAEPRLHTEEHPDLASYINMAGHYVTCANNVCEYRVEVWIVELDSHVAAELSPDVAVAICGAPREM